MKRDKVYQLSLLVREFVEAIAPQIQVCIVPEDFDYESGDGLQSGIITADETLAQWMQLPDCSYSYMFLGWMAGTGRNVSEVSPVDVEQAVCIALTGGKKNVMIDYEADPYAKKKLN